MTSLRREDLIRALPYARRYARALTGNQTRGDALVAESLPAILAETSPEPARQALYRHVTRAFSVKEAGMPGNNELSQAHRQLLLLTSLEELPVEAAAHVLGIEPGPAAAMLDEARQALRSAAAASVLIIEDEPIIAMDIEELVTACGHDVVGVASTEREAVDLAARHRPGLILADINLGTGGDGTSAVARILQSHYAPVIFVTAYPERLLTGDTVEPAYVITKPFEPLTLAIATYQAVTGGINL